ncbi:MAG: hypothetical protein EPO11_02080 [Gammaproteobacteria bacterium]|nr:MAG: hypothetical protein EPO11_02080 [Gammaproteobacteria bacterium]
MRAVHLVIIAALLCCTHLCFAATPQPAVSGAAKYSFKNAEVKKKTTTTRSSAKQSTRTANHSVKKSKKKSRSKSHRIALHAAKQYHAQINPNPPVADDPPPGFMASMEQRLINFVHKTVNTLRYSAYKLGGSRFDTSHGIYIVDCSRYVDNILQAIYPHAYSTLVDSSGSERPTSQDYYEFFTSLSEKSRYHWNKVDAVEELKPGDILVFRYKNTHGGEAGGHVMIVMDKPTQDADDNAFFVRVADSAAAGHSEDTRQRRTSGIGIGTLLLKVDPNTYQPSAYAWKIGSPWKHNVNFAMARPSDEV